MDPEKSAPTFDATSAKIAFWTGINTSSTPYPGFVSTVYKKDETIPSPEYEPLQGIFSPLLKQRVSNEGLGAGGTGTGLGAGGATGLYVGFGTGGGATGFMVGLRVGLGSGAGGTHTHFPFEDLDLPVLDLPDFPLPQPCHPPLLPHG